MTMVKRCSAGVVALLMSMAMFLSQAVVAHAETLNSAPQDQWVLLQHNNGEYALGVVAVGDGGRKYYCIQAHSMLDYVSTPVTTMADSEVARRLAWIMDHYQHGDAREQAAIAVVVQDHAGIAKSEWQSMLMSVRRQYPDVVTRAEAMWQESAKQVPSGLAVEQTYVEAERVGKVKVTVENYAGQLVEGVKFTAVLEGPAKFANGTNRVTGVSSKTPAVFDWKATGAGEVKVKTDYDAEHALVMDATQKLISRGESTSVSGSALNFTVRKGFSPAVSTVASERVVDAGQPIYDDVASGLASEGNVWADGVALKASGYYFTGLKKEILASAIQPNQGEGVAAFLNRLAAQGYTPAAYGSATFDGTGQSEHVQAMTEPGGETPYYTDGSGGFGTWVWAFAVDEQSEQGKQYLESDWISPFGEAEENSSNRAKVEVESTVTEHSAHQGAQLSDTITVSGFPEDHGTFEGDDASGFNADQPYAKVSVWWAGDESDAANDEQYIPTDFAVPEEDEHHRRLAAWEIPATNGTFKVGDGALDAHGEPMTITANQHGWYVFVWEFDGDDRVMPATSAYDDAWERVRVLAPEEPEQPEEPETPQEPELPHTGSSIGSIALCAVAALAVSGIMVACIKRRS